MRGDLTLHDNLLLYGSRIVVPKSLRAATLRKIHNGHQGIQRCRQRTTSSVWWPGVSRHIEQLVKSCPICAKASTPHKEPLMYSPLPNIHGRKLDRIFSSLMVAPTYWLWTISHDSLKSRSYCLSTPGVMGWLRDQSNSEELIGEVQ